MPKDIVLLSDGTGNGASKLFKTNVWRLYQMLDLSDQDRQIASYDNGVGTSAFRPLAILGGAIGWGLKRNVQDLYAFLCRHYRPGDRIHLFGFSRGAFTIRVLSGIITHVGVVRPPIREDHLDLAVADAYRKYRRRFKVTGGLVTPLRALRDRIIGWKRRLSGQPTADRVDYDTTAGIEFIGGAWDTVAAYGTPLDEMTRGVDYYLWPLSMPDRHLSEKAKRACHALAIDDERESFHPMLWTEERRTLGACVIDDDTQRSTNLDSERLSQVWFLGMHTDVGGGYPDDALALVTLDWMLKRIEAWKARQGGVGLSLLAGVRQEMVLTATPLGPLHDSRKGLAGYYRYTPRDILALCHRSVRGHRAGERSDRVIVHRPKIHESVFTRLREGTNGYAPFTLPERYAIVRDDGRIVEGQPETPAMAANRMAGQREVWNTVWKRRVVFFASLGVSLWLASFPFIPGYGRPVACNRPQCAIVPLFEALRAVLPEFTGVWLDAFARRPGWFLIAVAILVWLLYLGGSLDQRVRDRMKPLWAPISPAYASAPTIAPGRLDGAIFRLRTSPAYIAFFRLLKYQLGPLFFGVAFLLVALGALLVPAYVLANRAAFWIEDRNGGICRAFGTPVAVGEKPETLKSVFVTSTPCFATGLSVQAKARYQISLAVEQPWVDRTIRTTPVGFGGDASTWRMKLAVPLNRSVTSRWMQPIARIRSEKGREVPLEFTEDPAHSSVFVATLTAPLEGDLYLFVNDTVMPWHPWRPRWGFYDNNLGSARVTVKRLAAPSDTPSP